MLVYYKRFYNENRKGFDFNMKKILLIFLVAVLSLSVAACGKKKVDTSKSNHTAATDTDGNYVRMDGETSAIVDSDGNAIPGTAQMNAGAEVDMSKFDGESLTAEEAGEFDAPSSGAIGNFEVSIDDAKILERDGNKALIVSFTFKNNSTSPQSFDGIMSTEVTQDGLSLQPTVITDIDGITALAACENIEKGKTTKLQKIFVIKDTEAPVDVLVYKYGEPNGTQLAKTFKFN